MKHLEEPPPGFNRARGHLEIARELRASAASSSVGQSASRLSHSASSTIEGGVVSLKRAARWTRNDIVDAMSRDFGDYVFNAGFLQGGAGPCAWAASCA